MPMRDDQGLIVTADSSVADRFVSGKTDDAPGAFAADAPQERRSAGREPIAARISGLLGSRRPALMCDDCIADQLGLSHRRQANRVTVAMGNTSTFWRDVGACTVCSKHKQVIRRV